MQVIESFLTANPCYVEGQPLSVLGLMLHSVGTPQPSAKVFVKKWNTPTHTRSCVHGFIDANTGDIYQTLPWTMRAWHCGKGTNGSGNNTHIGVEMCEPPCIKYTGGSKFTVSDPELAKEYAERTYRSAVSLFAYLAKQHGINPDTPGAIISHAEGHKLGIASNHADPEHLWRGLGMSYTMDTFRADVKEAMGETPDPPKPEPGIVQPTVDSVIGKVKQLEPGDFLNVRKGPGSAYGINPEWPRLSSGNAFEILGTDATRKWLYILIAGPGYSVNGWVYSKYVEL